MRMGDMMEATPPRHQKPQARASSMFQFSRGSVKCTKIWTRSGSSMRHHAMWSKLLE